MATVTQSHAQPLFLHVAIEAIETKGNLEEQLHTGTEKLPFQDSPPSGHQVLKEPNAE